MTITFILLYFIFTPDGAKDNTKDGVYALIWASVIWTLCLFGITEVFSLFTLLNGTAVRVMWLTLAIGSALFLYLRRGRKRKYDIPGPEILILCLLGLGVLLLALWTVPYNWDSMTYHLPRIMHWAQNGSVAHYATNSVRQLGSPVLAEYVNLHVYLLCGGSDRAFALLQSVSYLLSVRVIYGISRKLGAGRYFAFLAALIYMAMPIAFAEALTTQVDHFATLWLLYFSYVLLDFTGRDKKLVFDKSVCCRVCLLGLLVSFGYLTKPSVCIAMAVMVLWLLCVCIARRDSPSVIIKLTGCVLPVILLPILPGLVRNIRTFGAISPPMVGERQLIGTLLPEYVLLNFTKNFTYNMPVPFWRGSAVLFTIWIGRLAKLLGVYLNDPRISENGQNFVMHQAPEFGHDTAINPLCMYLFLFCVAAALVTRRKRRERTGQAAAWSGYAMAVTAAFAIFCMALRWEPYVTRYMLSYLALLCPVIAVVLQDCLPAKWKKGVLVVVCLCCTADLAGLGRFHTEMCTEYGAGKRPEGYFANRMTEYEPYSEICEMIRQRGCRQVGISMKENNYEYPFWVMLDGTVERMEHVAVKNDSKKYFDEKFIPDCIIRLGKKPKSGLTVNGVKYKEIVSFGDGFYLLFAGK